MMASLNREEFFFKTCADDYWSRWQSFETIGTPFISLPIRRNHRSSLRIDTPTTLEVAQHNPY